MIQHDLRLIAALTIMFFLGLVTINFAYAQTTNTELPKEKQTNLGLYVNAKEAYEKWKANPTMVKILDVRTPDEYIDIGHATGAWNIPAFLQTYHWDESKQHFSIKPNPDFMAHIKEVFKSDDTIFVMCRSGGRSAWAVNQLAAAGFKNVYNITDGFEGDTVDDPQSVYVGQRLKNGWKNSGVPWTYSIDPKLMKLPSVK
jgi:rhodanese-related sulfurtransferase